MSRSSRRGFTLVEVLVSMVLISTVMLGLVPITMRVARLASQSTGLTQRAAALDGEVQRVMAMPFDSLPSGNACRSVESAGLTGTVCLVGTVISSATRQVAVIVTPSGGPVGPDTATVQRSRPASANPLNLP